MEIQRSQYIRPKVTVHKGAEIIQGRKLFKGGNYQLLGGFDRRNYSKEESIQGKKLYEEVRYLKKITGPTKKFF